MLSILGAKLWVQNVFHGLVQDVLALRATWLEFGFKRTRHTPILSQIPGSVKNFLCLWTDGPTLPGAWTLGSLSSYFFFIFLFNRNRIAAAPVFQVVTINLISSLVRPAFRYSLLETFQIIVYQFERPF